MKRKLIAVLLSAMLLVSVTGLVAVSAKSTTSDFAAEFNTSDNEGGILAYGRTQAEIVAALEAKVDEVNAKIAAANAAGTSLADAYASGEIPTYSKKNNGIIGKDNIRPGNSSFAFKNWDGRPVIDVASMQGGIWGESIVFLSYNGKTDTGVFVVGKFADKYSSSKLGAPLGDSFKVYDNGTDGDYTAYQNFAGGYMASRNGGDCTETIGKTVVVKDGVSTGAAQTDWVDIVDVESNAAGYVGAGSKKIIDSTGISGQELARRFAAAYERYENQGIRVGYEFNYLEKKYGIFTQSFRKGDSVATPWEAERGNWAVLSYNDETGEVFLIKDEFFYVYENGGDLAAAAKSLGAPTGDDFVFDGNRYQNFANGYMKAAGATPKNGNISEVVKGKRIGTDGAVSDIALADKVGSVQPGITLPKDYTPETFGKLFKDKYAEVLAGFELASLDQVKTVNGVLAQVYADSDGETVAIAYDKVNDAVRYLSVGAYAAFKDSAGLGCPTTDRFQVAEGSANLPAVFAQGFENGYIKIKITTQFDLDDNGDVIEFKKEIGSTTIGATYDAEKGVFSTISYVNEINKVADNVSSAYDFLEVPAKEELIALFQDAYNKAFAIGFSAGKPSDEGILWWTTNASGVVKLTLKGGNGNANFWGDNTIMLYDCDNKVVRISTGAIANTYANAGASGNGWATSEMRVNTKTGTIVQQFNISDTDVKNRKVYIIVPNGDASKAGKVTGEYDFEANKEGGEWVDYLTQFGGDSVSAKPVEVEDSYAKGEALTVDFSAFLTNDAKYTVKYELVSALGSIDEATGVFTLTPDSDGNVEVEVLAYTAFDKVTLKATLHVGSGGGGAEEPTPSPSAGPARGCGCGSIGFTGGITGGLMGLVAVAAVVALCIAVIKRRALKDR